MLGINKKKNTKIVQTFFKEQWKEVELIGEGSYGKVFKAKKEEFGIATYSAIKQIEIPQSNSEIHSLKTEGMTQADITKYYEKSVKKWVEEIKFMSIFKDSSNIVNIEDYEVISKKGQIGWIINIRMELLKNLDNYILEKNVTDKEMLKMAIDIATALEDCEQNNVVHRDIKPDNIFVNKKGIYKVGDFGIAKKIENTVSNMSKKGTENYMAPELYKDGKGNKTVDIYSLGIMLYRYFNYNRLPFMPDYPNEITLETREEALYKRISGEKMKAPLNATREIAEIILKCCSYYPKDRYKNATELKKDLQKVYQKIEKPTVIFDFNTKQMNKIYTENTKSGVHESTVSILTGMSDEEKENFNTPEEIQKEVQQYIEEAEESPNEPYQYEGQTKIKSKFSVKLKEHKIKIIIISIIILILITLLGCIKLWKGISKNIQASVVMPKVLGMQSELAVEKLKDLDLEIEYEYVETENSDEIGKVIEQSVLSDEKVEKGTVIKLKIAVSPQKIKVINVAGMTSEEAKAALEEIGLKINMTEQYNEEIEQGRIISQMPLEGEEVYKNSTVEVLVSLGMQFIEKDYTEIQNPKYSKSNQQEQQSKKQIEDQTTQVQQQTQTQVQQPVQQQVQQPAQPQIVAPTSIQLGNTTSFLQKGSSITITANVLPSNANNKTVVWSSSNPSVLSVGSDGTVTGVGTNGSATITATVSGTGVTASCNITVYVKGDMNGDGAVNSVDASIVLDKYNSGSVSQEDLLRGDMNGDGRLNSTDSSIILDSY